MTDAVYKIKYDMELGWIVYKIGVGMMFDGTFTTYAYALQHLRDWIAADKLCKIFDVDGKEIVDGQK